MFSHHPGGTLSVSLVNAGEPPRFSWEARLNRHGDKTVTKGRNQNKRS
jgi:hypothetical protein